MRIEDVAMVCSECGWTGTLGEAVPDVDGEGSLGCPMCLSVAKEVYDQSFMQN